MQTNSRLGTEWARYLEVMKERPEVFANTGEIHIVTDEIVVSDFQEKTNQKIGVVYESAYSIMVVDLVYEEEGKYFAYERVLPAVENPAVVCVPIYRGSMLLLKQYRHAMRDYEYSFPRGFGEKGLSGEENCKKELLEEIGAIVKETKYLGKISPDSGLQGKMVQVYVCELETYDENIKSEGICEILEIPPEEIFKWITEGKIADGFTLAAMSMFQANQKYMTWKNDEKQ